MDYQVDLDVFRGPLDLLLYLVKRHEVDILDIPIARITASYLRYLEVLKLIDVEHAGDFLVLAATLMEIKSKLLLPRPETPTADEPDPRAELVKQLLAYKQFKDAAALLEERAEAQAARLPRQPPERVRAPVDPARQPIQQVELWDLVSAFGRLLRETLAAEPRPIVYDDTPIHVHMDHIAALLAARGRLRFAEVFEPPHTRGRLIGLFMALLELIKGKRLQAEQEAPFADVWLTPLAPEAAAVQTAGPGVDGSPE